MEFGRISFFGRMLAVLLLLPNIVYAFKRRDRDGLRRDVPKFLSVLEQIGRYACMILMGLPLLIGKFGFKSAAALALYLVLNGLLLLTYDLIWIVYSKKPTLKNALALAFLPAAMFLISGALLCHWLLVGAAVLFGVSHGRITYLTHSGKEN